MDKIDIKIHEANLISILLKNPELIYEIDLDKTYFSNKKGKNHHRAMFAVMSYLSSKKDIDQLVFDSMTLLNIAKKHKDIAQVFKNVFDSEKDFIQYVSSLKEFDVDKNNIDFYIEELKKAKAANKLFEKNQNLYEDIMNNYDNYNKEDIINIAEESILKLGTIVSNDQDNSEHVGDNIIDFYDNREASENEFVGLPTPWEALNKRTTGILKPGDVTIFNANTGVGKSVLLKQIASLLGIAYGKTVYWAFNEMLHNQQRDRLIAENTNKYITIDQIKKGIYNKKGNEKMKEDVLDAAKKIKQSNIYLDRIRNYTPEQLVRKAKYYKKRFDIDVFIWDYVKLSGGKKRGEENRHFLGRVVNMLKENIADPLGIPVVTASQAKTYEWHMPAESEDIRRNCTNFVSIYKKSNKEIKKSPLGGKYKMFVGKARDGGEHNDPKADGIELDFNKKKLQFYEMG